MPHDAQLRKNINGKFAHKHASVQYYSSFLFLSIVFRFASDFRPLIYLFSFSGKFELILFKKLVLHQGFEDRIIKLRLSLRQTVAMETPKPIGGYYPLVLFTPHAQHVLATESELERSEWSKEFRKHLGQGKH